MNERIIDFVRSCPECQQNKASRHQPYGLSSLVELPYAPWHSIAMDFITKLPISDGCDQLWEIIDRFTKMAYFLPLGKEGKTVADLAAIFAREVWKHHGLPTDIVSDCDSQEFGPECQQRCIHRLMAKQSGSTKRSKPTSERSLARNRTTGYVCYRWPSSPTTTRPPRVTVCLHSTLTTASTQQP